MEYGQDGRLILLVSESFHHQLMVLQFVQIRLMPISHGPMQLDLVIYILGLLIGQHILWIHLFRIQQHLLRYGMKISLEQVR